MLGLNRSLVRQYVSLESQNYTTTDVGSVWKYSESQKRREKGTKTSPFFVFAINNFHCCMEAISTTQREKQCNQEQKPACLEETIKKNNIETTIFYKFIPKYTEEKINIQMREASLTESDTPAGRLGTSNTAREQHGTSSSRPNEPKSG